MIPIAAVWVLGASFVGADWHTGFMVTTLTWESRRVRLALAKAFVIVVTAAVVAVAFMLLTGLAIGAEAGPLSEWIGPAFPVIARGAWLAVLASMVGFGVAIAARSTAASLGAGFAYLFAVEGALSALIPDIQPWLLVRNAVAFLLSEETFILPGRSPTEAAIILTSYGFAALAGGIALFASRDVT
jgi:ABC-2 type transport system permease protein